MFAVNDVEDVVTGNVVRRAYLTGDGQRLLVGKPVMDASLLLCPQLARYGEGTGAVEVKSTATL